MLDLSDRADLRWLSALIRDAQGIESEIDWMLVGALARDIRLNYAHDIQIARATMDVDLAIATDGWEGFKTSWRAMLVDGLFTKVHGMQRVRHASEFMVDLIPYGGVEGEGGTISWPPHGDVFSRVIGFREVRAAAEPVRLPDGVEVAVVTLPGLLVLKLFAFKDRAIQEPRKDAEDIYLVLRSYTDAGNSLRLYAKDADLLEMDGFDYVHAGARMAGRDVWLLLAQATTGASLRTQLSAIVDDELDPDGRLRFLGQVPSGHGERCRQLLIAFRSGLHDG